MSNAIARVKGVSKTFGEGRLQVRALDDVNLELHAGQLTLLEGPSGSGKTTLLHVIGLLHLPDEGEVWIENERMDQRSQKMLTEQRREHVAMVFQVYNLLEALSARDNVALAELLSDRTTVGGDGVRQLERVNLSERQTHLPAQLSGGERQRVAIARALASPGRLVLADEPTANLDWENARDVIEAMVKMAHEENKAVVVVSHDARLEPYADRIVRMLDGRIVGDNAIASDKKQEPSMKTRDIKKTTASLAPMPSSRRRGVSWVVTLILGVVLMILGWSIGRAMNGPPASSQQKPAADTKHVESISTPYVAAAPAVVEPSNKLIALRSERRGRIRAILKQAGDAIVKDEPLVLIDDITAQVAVAQAQADLALAESSLAELKAWDRPEEQARVGAQVDYAKARFDRATREVTRLRKLNDEGSAPQVELDDAEEEFQLAASKLDEVSQTYKVSQAGPTEAELNVAQAEVKQAQTQLQMAEAELTLLTIRSPLDGHVIYRHLEPGEVVDPEVPGSILSIGKLDEVRLRAEVDEADIERVAVGQQVEAMAEAFGDRVFHGKVVHLEPMMGRKTIRTERTTEQQDTKVREVLIELDADDASLPIDLQMTVRFIGE